MVSEQGLSVEIFRDSDFEHIDTDVAESGIDVLSRIHKGIAIVRASRLFTIAPKGQEYIDPFDVEWPEFDADHNIILTEKTIFGARGNPDRAHQVPRKPVAATTVRIGSDSSFKLSIVGIYTALRPELNVAHELAHQFNVKNSGKDWDGAYHCNNSKCVMYHKEVVTAEDTATDTNQQNEFMSLFMMHMTGIFDKNQIIKIHNEDFCDECAGQIDQNVFLLKRAKTG